MNKGFNPTREDLLKVEQLILDIKSKKDGLIKNKISFQNSLSAWKDKYKDVGFKSPEFEDVKTKRASLKKGINNIEIKIRKINEELTFKNKMKNEIVFYLKNNKVLEGKEDLDKLINSINLLQKKYKDFAKDRTRISSLRVMASEISGELDKILKI